jgi:hypothetical protein
MVDQAQEVQREQRTSKLHSEGMPDEASENVPSQPQSPSTQETQEREQRFAWAWGRTQG